MISITVHLDQEGGHTSINVEGHEYHAESGRVCAAVTAVTNACILGLEAISAAHPTLASIEIHTEDH